MRRLLLIVTALSSALPAAAQTPRADRIGHVVAIVGDSVVLNFDIDAGILAYEAQTRQRVTDAAQRAQLEQELLQDRIDGLLLVQAALRDTTIRVPDEQVSRIVQQQIEEQQRQLGGAIDFERALREAGLTLQDYRDRIAAQIRTRELINQLRGKIRRERKAPPATEADLRELFEASRAQFGQRPATVTFYHIVVRTEASPEALGRARARADSVFGRLLAGEKFEELAKRYSDDASRDQGGDIGWGRRTDYVRDFANVAWSLAPGQISRPVRTQYGYHIIKAERVRGAEMHLRHILFKPELTDADAVRARARADTVAERLRANAPATELQAQYGDPDVPLRNGPIEIERVQTSLGIDVSEVTTGQVIGPVPRGGETVADEFNVLRIIEREAARAWTLNDPLLRERLRQEVELQKLMREYLDELRRATYVEIRGS